jgi:hypothetical protein
VMPAFHILNPMEIATATPYSTAILNWFKQNDLW